MTSECEGVIGCGMSPGRICPNKDAGCLSFCRSSSTIFGSVGENGWLGGCGLEASMHHSSLEAPPHLRCCRGDGRPLTLAEPTAEKKNIITACTYMYIQYIIKSCDCHVTVM